MINRSLGTWLAALLAVVVTLVTGPASASPATRVGPDWAHHLQKPTVEVVPSVQHAPVVAPPVVPEPARATAVVPEGSRLLGERLASIKAEITRPLSPNKVRVVVDLESPAKAVWIRHRAVETAIPSTPAAGTQTNTAGLSLTGLEQMARGGGWDLPSAIVIDYAGNRLGVRRGSAVEYLDRAAVLGDAVPRTTRRHPHTRRPPVLVARR